MTQENQKPVFAKAYVPQWLWDKAGEIAQKLGKSKSDIINDGLRKELQSLEDQISQLQEKAS